MSREAKIEEAARVLIIAWEACPLDPDTQEGLLMDLRDALAQPATGGDEYRRGVEDAARVLDQEERDRWRGQRRVRPLQDLADAIRALSPPPDTERCGACSGTGSGVLVGLRNCPACGGSGGAEGGK